MYTELLTSMWLADEPPAALELEKQFSIGLIAGTFVNRVIDIYHAAGRPGGQPPDDWAPPPTIATMENPFNKFGSTFCI
jgi:hypothetical protein